jgi:hypothetical protein
MNPIHNPYAPGAGMPPPELAGRDELRRRLEVAIGRVLIGNPGKSVILVGLRGVGKTVLLEQMRQDADHAGVHTLRLEASENRSLPALLSPQLRLALLKLSTLEDARAAAQHGLRALAGFARALKPKYYDIEVGIDLEPEQGLADNGDLEGDLTSLFEQVGRAARQARTAIVLFMDELQYVEEEQLAALITALHRCVQQKLPVMLVGAGLPQLVGNACKAKSYAERLFDYPVLKPLSRSDAALAITKPAEALNVSFVPAAVDWIIDVTQGYPYFLQEWSKQAWDAASGSPITPRDVQTAGPLTIAALDEGFFKVRFDRCKPGERRYLRAMAELGPGPHRSGDIAARLGKSVNTLAPVRNSLIIKGMVWSPNHGETSFTVPLFDQFMRRAMPMPAAS